MTKMKLWECNNTTMTWALSFRTAYSTSNDHVEFPTSTGNGEQYVKGDGKIIDVQEKGINESPEHGPFRMQSNARQIMRVNSFWTSQFFFFLGGGKKVNPIF